MVAGVRSRTLEREVWYAFMHLHGGGPAVCREELSISSREMSPDASLIPVEVRQMVAFGGILVSGLEVRRSMRSWKIYSVRIQINVISKKSNAN